MKTFAITTFGCKVNQYESQQTRQKLEDSGLRPAAHGETPDLVIVRTCCVTASAASKSRRAIAKAGKLYPTATVLATGCLAAIKDDGIRKTSPKTVVQGLDVNLPPAIERLLSGKSCGCDSQNSAIKPENTIQSKNKNPSATPLLEGGIRAFTGQTRAFLKIQDGCDAHCTYCIIPHIRRELRSKAPQAVLDEARALVEAGHREIVLTGIFLGAYGRTTARRKKWTTSEPDHLASLVAEVAAIPGLARLRLSSLEPGDLTDALLDVIARHPNVAGHLHLPLQAGSDYILRRMARQYRLADYLHIIEKLQARLDRPAITTDIIVGFPGEMKQDFARTISVARQIGFAKIHVFPFSSRQGTAAERLAGHLAASVIRDRVNELTALDVELQDRFRKRFAGEKVGVILENRRPAAGRCERYFMVNAPGAPKGRPGDLIYGTLSPDGQTMNAST
jgi:threonylcarbamoyladenosine tRNA methylthiotransferase MtaB